MVSRGALKGHDHEVEGGDHPPPVCLCEAMPGALNLFLGTSFCKRQASAVESPVESHKDNQVPGAPLLRGKA